MLCGPCGMVPLRQDAFLLSNGVRRRRHLSTEVPGFDQLPRSSCASHEQSQAMACVMEDLTPDWPGYNDDHK
jgi:hypothetical protein